MAMQRSVFDNFEKGDFLYGLESVRAMYRPGLRKLINDQKYPITVDDLNNKVLLFAKPKGKWSEEGEAAALSYVSNPRDSGLSPSEAKLYEEHLRILKATSNPKLNITRNDFPESKKGLSNSERTLIRICKLAILEYPKVKNCTIHFLLDNIELQHVVDREYSESKSPPKSGYGSVKRDARILHDTYTSAELRFILKHYEEILEQEGSVKFYENNEEIDLLDWILAQPKPAQYALKAYANYKELTKFLDLFSHHAKAVKSEEGLSEKESKGSDSEPIASEGLLESSEEDLSAKESKIRESESSVSESDFSLSPLSLASEDSLSSPVSQQPISPTPAQILAGGKGVGLGHGVFKVITQSSSLPSLSPSLSLESGKPF